MNNFTYNEILNNFPTYRKTLSSFERSIIGGLGWCCSIKYSEDFDETMNHKFYDANGTPRIIDQPVDFSI